MPENSPFLVFGDTPIRTAFYGTHVWVCIQDVCAVLDYPVPTRVTKHIRTAYVTTLQVSCGPGLRPVSAHAARSDALWQFLKTRRSPTARAFAEWINDNLPVSTWTALLSADPAAHSVPPPGAALLTPKAFAADVAAGVRDAYLKIALRAQELVAIEGGGSAHVDAALRRLLAIVNDAHMPVLLSGEVVPGAAGLLPDFVLRETLPMPSLDRRVYNAVRLSGMSGVRQSDLLAGQPGGTTAQQVDDAVERLTAAGYVRVGRVATGSREATRIYACDQRGAR